MKNLILCFFILLGTTACANLTGLAHPDMILMKAKILKIGPGDKSSLRSTRTTIDFGMDFPVYFSVEDMLIGHLQQIPPSVVLRMSALPNLDKPNQIYILARVSNKGELKIIDWDSLRAGMCFTRQTAQKLNIEKELLLLYESGRLICLSTRNSANKFLD